MTTDDDLMDVSVTVEFHLRGVVSKTELAELGESLSANVTRLIRSEGLFGLIEGDVPGPDSYLIEIKEWQS